MRLNIWLVRWDYTVTPREMLLTHKALVRVPGGMELTAWPADWGPHSSTGRVADLSPCLMKDLGLKTDDAGRSHLSGLRNIGKLTIDDMVIVGEGYKARLIRVGSISTIEVWGNKIIVRTNGIEPLTMLGSLAHCKKRLPAAFFCAGRSCLVNLAEVFKVDTASRLFILTMKNGTLVEMSRRQSRVFRTALAL